MFEDLKLWEKQKSMVCVSVIEDILERHYVYGQIMSFSLEADQLLIYDTDLKQVQNLRFTQIDKIEMISGKRKAAGNSQPKPSSSQTDIRSMQQDIRTAQSDVRSELMERISKLKSEDCVPVLSLVKHLIKLRNESISN